MATRKTGGTEAGTGNGGKAASKGAPRKTNGGDGGVKGPGRAAGQSSTAAETGDGGGRPAPNVTPKKAAGGGAAKSATKKSAGGATKSPGKTASKGTAKMSAGGAKGGDMRPHLRDFASTRLGGWSHDDWEGLLGNLQQRGFDVSDRDAVGMALERERLHMMLEKVPGVSSAKARTLTDRFGRLWDLRNASADEIAQAGKVPRDVAERISQSLRQ